MKLPKFNQQGFAWFIVILFTAVAGVGLLIGGNYFKSLLLKTKNLLNIAGVANTPFVSASGTKLYLHGQEYQFTGINAYELATLPGVNAGCGSYVPDIEGFFQELRPNSMVRFWAFQGAIATNIKTKQLDWGQFDRVVNTAAKYNQKLLVVLSPQSGQCDDGHWKDRAWYNGGYNQVFNDDGRGLAPLSFLDYAKTVAARYKDSTAIGMYELVSEPEPSDCQSGYTGEACYTHMSCNRMEAREALRSFFDNAGTQIKQIAPNHLIQSGMMGSGQCGGVFDDYSYVHQSTGVDVASYHDYGKNDQPMPGDIYNGLQKRLDQMKVVGKPLVVGEVGMAAHATATNCPRLTDRVDKFKAKMDAQFSAGVAGFIPWDWVYRNQGICTYDINPGDPLLTLLHDYPVSMPTPPPTPMVSPTADPSAIPTPMVSATPIPTPVPTPQPPSTKLGGVNLSSYCKSLGLPNAVLGNGSWQCGATGSPIDMSRACQWQYKNNAAYAKQDISGNSYSWSCYLPPLVTPTPTPIPQVLQRLGGLNLSGFCKSLGYSTSAALVNGVWRCGASGQTINMDSACRWQYQIAEAFAKQGAVNDPFTWGCYRYL